MGKESNAEWVVSRHAEIKRKGKEDEERRTNKNVECKRQN
jgi:hypothetical protein